MRLIVLVFAVLFVVGPSFAQGIEQKTKTEAADRSVAIYVSVNPQYSYYGYDVYQQVASNLLAEMKTAVAATGKWTVVAIQQLIDVHGLQKLMGSGLFDRETVPRSNLFMGVRWAIYVEVKHLAVTSDLSGGRNVVFRQGLEFGARQITYTLAASAYLVDVERLTIIHQVVDQRVNQNVTLASLRVPTGGGFFVTKELELNLFKNQSGRITRVMAQRLAQKLAGFDPKLVQFRKRLLIAKLNADGTAIINQGQDDGIKVGELYSQGEAIRDPDSNQLLGFTTETIIEVVKVKPSFSVAKILQGRPRVAGEITAYSGPRPEPKTDGVLAEPTASRQVLPPFQLQYGTVRKGDRGVVWQDKNGNDRYDGESEKLAEVIVVEVTNGNVVTLEVIGDYVVKGGERVHFD